MRLFHVSEEPGIPRFEPRHSPRLERNVVWAIAESHLAAYLVPRDCPRITFYADEGTTDAERARFLGRSERVMMIENAWYHRLRTTALFCYELPSAPFELADRIAGYFVSPSVVEPLAVTRVDDLVGELLGRGVELRIVPSLWPLRDEVVASTLAFSIIRLRPLQPPASNKS